jgi:predicted nucleic acid-binding protein
VTGWLLDTNVLSELRRPKPDRKVGAFIAAQPLELLYVSAITLAEIRFGIEVVTDATRRAELNDWLAHKVRPMFEQRALPITEDIMFKWRLLAEDRRKAGYTFSQPDLIIAATALHHGLTVVTRDVSDYKRARTPIFNPWVDPLPPALREDMR